MGSSFQYGQVRGINPAFAGNLLGVTVTGEGSLSTTLGACARERLGLALCTIWDVSGSIKGMLLASAIAPSSAFFAALYCAEIL